MNDFISENTSIETEIFGVRLWYSDKNADRMTEYIQNQLNEQQWKNNCRNTLFNIADNTGAMHLHINEKNYVCIVKPPDRRVVFIIEIFLWWYDLSIVITEKKILLIVVL